VYGPGRPAGGARSLGSRVGWALVLMALLILAVWFVAGAFFAIVRILELVIVAAAAGWVGFRLGRRSGRRHP